MSAWRSGRQKVTRISIPQQASHGKTIQVGEKCDLRIRVHAIDTPFGASTYVYVAGIVGGGGQRIKLAGRVELFHVRSQCYHPVTTYRHSIGVALEKLCGGRLGPGPGLACGEFSIGSRS